MNTFAVGEIVIIAWTPSGNNIGEEVEIMTELFIDDHDLGHTVLNKDGLTGFFYPENLRKIPPKQDQSTWEEVGWNPFKELVT